MQMQRPTSIALPAPWHSMHSDFTASLCDSNSPTPTSENPTASFGSLGSHASGFDFGCMSASPKPEDYTEDEEIAWSASSLRSSFSSSEGESASSSSSRRSSYSDMYAPEEVDEEPEPIAPLPSWPAVTRMQRSSSCSYDQKSSSPSRLLSGTSGGASMVRSYSNPLPSLHQPSESDTFAREARQMQDQEQWSPFNKMAAATTYDIATLSPFTKEPAMTASSLYNNPYRPATSSEHQHQQHVLHPQHGNSASSPSQRPRLGRFFSYEPSISAREHANLF